MRRLKQPELDLISFLLKDKPGTASFIELLPGLFAEEMHDGGMGSLRFDAKGKTRVLGKQIAEINLKDIDGISLSITLNLDQFGEMFELDIWKVDFSPLKQFPVHPYIYDE